MAESRPTHAQPIARAAGDCERQRTGRVPKSVAVMLAGIAEVRELYRLLFAEACGPLRETIRQITGVEVRGATAEGRTATAAAVLVFTTGAVVLVFLLAGSVPPGSGGGSGPGG